MEQILQSTYLNDPDKWQTEANRLGGLEICDDDTGDRIMPLMPPKLIEGTSAPICYFFKIYNPYYLHEKGLDRFISGNKVQFAINTPDDTIVIFDDKIPILYTGLGVWEVLSFQRMVTEED